MRFFFFWPSKLNESYVTEPVERLTIRTYLERRNHNKDIWHWLISMYRLRIRADWLSQWYFCKKYKKHNSVAHERFIGSITYVRLLTGWRERFYINETHGIIILHWIPHIIIVFEKCLYDYITHCNAFLICCSYYYLHTDIISLTVPILLDDLYISFVFWN